MKSLIGDTFGGYAALKIIIPGYVREDTLGGNYAKKTTTKIIIRGTFAIVRLLEIRDCTLV
jgi:hypothetical protein